MPKRAERPQSRRHILVWDEDWELLDSLYGREGPKPIGVSVAIRAVLHRKCNELRAAIAHRLDSAATAESREQELVSSDV